LLAVSAGAALSFRRIYEPDLWWHLAQGREAAGGYLVHSNVFSFIYPGYPQPYTPWLFDVGGYLAWQAGRGAGIQIGQAALLALAFALTYLACRDRASTSSAMAVLAVVFFVVEPRAIPRPHLATFAGIAACTLFIERARRTHAAAPLWWVIPIVALWSNLHVECVFGVLLVGVFACGELVLPSVLSRREARTALIIATVCAAATVANPYGWGLERYLVQNWQVPRVLDIAELRPASLPAYRAFFTYLVAGGLLLLWRIRTVALWEAAAAALFAILGARFLRFTPLVCFATAPLLAERVLWMTQRGVDSRAVVATAMAAGLVTSRLPLRTFLDIDAGTAAVAPAEFFSPEFPAFARAARLHGPVFNSMNLGGYVAWELYPAARIFQDGRLQAVPPDHFRAILDASRSQTAWNLLVSGVDWAVLSLPRPDQLSGAGRFPRDDWATVFWDEAVDVRVRRAGPFAPVAVAHEYQVLLPESDPIVVSGQLSGPDGARLRAEARRNMAENAGGFAAPAVLCLGGDAAACEDIERLAARHARFRAPMSRIRFLRQ
jgi:hypothetical protein